MALSELQDALLELRDMQLALELYRDENYADDGIVKDMYRSRLDECLAILGLAAQAGSEPMRWLLTVDGVRTLQRLMIDLLPAKIVTLTSNDRSLLELMLSIGATSPANCRSAEELMRGIGGGDHKKGFKRLKKGGYVMSGTGRGSGYYLTTFGKYVAKEIK